VIGYATSRFHAAELIRASCLAPVRITLYPPRFPLTYELAGEVPELAPIREIFRLPWEQFEPAFIEQLNQLEWIPIENRLHDIARSVGAHGCVLLCFEDVLAGENCHWRLVADWITKWSGAEVPELEPGDRSWPS
jgi:hypothetical protein